MIIHWDRGDRRQPMRQGYSGVWAWIGTAGEDAEQNIVPGLQFSFIPDRFDFSAPPNTQDFTAGDD